jgi:hypothetical protein
MKTDNGGVMIVPELADHLRVHPAKVYPQVKLGEARVQSRQLLAVEAKSIARWRLVQSSSKVHPGLKVRLSK